MLDSLIIKGRTVPRGSRAFTLFGQESDLTCKATVRGKEKTTLIDPEVSMAMIKTWDYFKLGLRKNEVDATKQKNISSRRKGN